MLEVPASERPSFPSRVPCPTPHPTPHPTPRPTPHPTPHPTPGPLFLYFAGAVKKGSDLFSHLLGRGSSVPSRSPHHAPTSVPSSRHDILQELCEGGDWFERLLENGTYSERQAASAARSVLEALQYCHSLGVVHRCGKVWAGGRGAG
eukprot:104393-Chlamydomonas_euryale.AAC.1